MHSPFLKGGGGGHIERDVKSLVSSLDVLSGDLKEPTHLSIRVD